ncbi:MAG: hypothetical protein IPN93_13505 [Bacteroidetes bacterium]|nr:hypothetical protein [Bacteroidota bacterium]MBK9635388.1 hypothetical protein [Bacteroidota bacterium]
MVENIRHKYATAQSKAAYLRQIGNSCAKNSENWNFLEITHKETWGEFGNLYQFKIPKTPKFKILGIDGNLIQQNEKTYSFLYLNNYENDILKGKYFLIEGINELDFHKPFIAKILLVDTKLKRNDTTLIGNANWILLNEVKYNSTLKDSIYFFHRNFGGEKIGIYYSKKKFIIGLSKFDKYGFERYYGFNKDSNQFHLNSIELASIDSCKKIICPIELSM